MRKAWIAMAVIALAGCDMEKFTSDTTSKVLARAQPSLNEESDYELAAAALPGTLKTIEGFWMVSPDNPHYLKLLTEGFCQYGSGFVEDEEEEALIAHDLERAAALDEHATKMFVRCMNYGLKSLGKAYREDLFGSEEVVTARLAKAGKGQRTPLMWVGIALASAIDHNKDRPEMTSMLDTAVAILKRVIEIDAKSGAPKDEMLAALPHVGLGRIYTTLSPSLGGKPEDGEKEFQAAIQITGGKFLLASVFEARWAQYRLQLSKDPGAPEAARKAFHDTLVKVLQTPPSIWPEQRLANEIAQRRARRYLSQEKELFP